MSVWRFEKLSTGHRLNAIFSDDQSVRANSKSHDHKRCLILGKRLKPPNLLELFLANPWALKSAFPRNIFRALKDKRPQLHRYSHSQRTILES